MGLLPSPAIRLLAAAALLAIGVTVVQADGHEHTHHKKIVIHVPDNVHYHHHQHFSKLIVPVKQHHHEHHHEPHHIEISHEHLEHDHDHSATTSSETGTTDLTWSATKGLGASWANSLKGLGHTAYSLGGHGLSGHGGYSFGGHKFAGYTGGSGSTSGSSASSGGSSEDSGSSATNTVEAGSVNALLGSSSNPAGSTVSLLGSGDSLGSYAIPPASFKHSGVNILTLSGHATPARANPFAWLQSHGWHTSPGATLRSAASTHGYAVRASKGWRAPRAYALVPAKRWRAAVLPAPPSVTATATPAAAAAAAAAAVALAKAPAFKPMTAVRAIPVAVTARVKV